MNRKQKKELREHQSTRQLMGIGQITERGVKTAKGELVFFLVRPDNLSVLSPEGVQGRVSALADLLRQDMSHLDEIQSSTASAREFAEILGIVCGCNRWLLNFQGRLVDFRVKVWYALPRLRRCCH